MCDQELEYKLFELLERSNFETDFAIYYLHTLVMKSEKDLTKYFQLIMDILQARGLENIK